MNINPSTPYYSFFTGSTAQGATSNGIFRGRYEYHQIQVNTAGATAQSFVLYTSNDGNTWTPIRDGSDVDSTVAGYSGATASGVIALQGAYPWLQLVTGTASASPFTATIYSTGYTEE